MTIRRTIIAALLWLGVGLATAQAAPVTNRAGPEAEKNKKAGEAFLAENKGREGVVTLKSGLQYKILEAGEGRKPTLADTVVVHYRGTLVDGTEFGDSYKGGKPGTFPVRGAIEGLKQALLLMPAGSKWQLVVPPHLAYGQLGKGRAIGPNATLIFEAKLVAVEGAPTGKPGSTAAALTGIQVSFKLDPGLTRSLYMGDRWVSPRTYVAQPQGKTSTVEASARGMDATGNRIDIQPEWKPSDPEMVEVKGRGRDVKITVKRAGESKLVVAFQGLTKELAIKASPKGEALAVEIAQ
jgi:FKBP-type peptidyl-prolyl cis-trans isomerase